MEKSESVIAVLLVVSILLSVASVVMINNKAGVSATTGRATGVVNATIAGLVDFKLDPDKVQFGPQALGASADTLGGSPAPFRMENTGSVKINMTVDSANALFTGASPVYQFNSSCAEADCAVYVDPTWTTFDQNAQKILGVLEFDNAKDLAQLDIKIGVPTDEPAGLKEDTLTFTASQYDA